MSVDMETNISIAGRKGVLSQEMTHPFSPIARGRQKEARLRETRERLRLLAILKNFFCEEEEQVIKIQQDAERIKKETEIISQTPDLDPQAAEAAAFIKNMTEEIMEQKQKLQQRNTGISKTSGVDKEHVTSATSVKETCRNVKIFLTQVTGLVQEKIHSLPENVKKKLASLMTSFQRLSAGIWRLLFIVLLLCELEKLIACIKFEGEKNCRRKVRLKYGYEMASMFALWLSHDVESNPGPSYDYRMSLESLVRQLSEALKQHLKIKGRLWSPQMGKAAKRAGFPSYLSWNNPSMKNGSGKKDQNDTLIEKAKELGHLLERKNCLSTDLAPLLCDLSSERGRARLRIHYKTENLKSAVEVLVSEELSSFEKEKICQILKLLNKVLGNCDQLHVCDGIGYLPSGRDFEQLADTMSNDYDLLTENALSPLDGRIDLGMNMKDNPSSEDVQIALGDWQTLDDFRNTNEDEDGQLSRQFVEYALPLATQTGTGGNENDLPDVSLINDFVHGNTNSLDTESEYHTAHTLQGDKAEICEISSTIRYSKPKTNTETTVTDLKDANNTVLAGYGDAERPEMNDTGENLITGAVGLEQIGESGDLSRDNTYVIHETSTAREDPEMQVENHVVTQVTTSESTCSHGNHTLLIEENTPETNIHLMLKNGEQTKQNLQSVSQVRNMHDSSQKDDHNVDEEQTVEHRVSTIDEGGLTEPAPASINDGKSHQHTSPGIGASLMEELQRLKQNFDDHLQNITRCVVDLNTQTSSPKAPGMNNLQLHHMGNDGSHHEYTAEKMGRGQRPMYPSGSDVEAEMLDDTHVQTSHCDHLEEATSTADQHEQARESSRVFSDADDCTRTGRRKRKKKIGICSSKKRRR